MFKVKVSGTYVISGRLAQIDAYEAEFKMSEGREAEARAIIQNSGMLDIELRKSKPNYKRWRTCQVIKITELKEQGKVDDKTKAANDEQAEIEALLIEATNIACIPVSYKSYVSDKLRKDALIESIKKKKKKIAKAKARVKGDKKGALEDAED